MPAEINYGEDLRRLESKVDRKVDMWINRGIGVWVAAALVFTMVQFGFKLMGK